MDGCGYSAGRRGSGAEAGRPHADFEHAGGHSGGHFQAVTQIHEQSLSFILKLLVVVLLLVGGGWMLETLQDFTRYLFTLM
ncbi:MAG: flagellar biosynthetic protein FliQ [Dysosmobacter sp.]